MSKISLIPDNVEVRIADCTKETFDGIWFYVSDYNDWLEKNRDTELDCTIKYPLHKPCKFKVKAGYAEDIIVQITDKYREIYKEEDESTSTPPGLIPGMLNRNTTNGKWGIWGHEIGDLILTDVVLDTDTLSLNLYIDS